MRKFDTKVQHLKYKVLREVARHAWNDTLLESLSDIPKTIVPGKNRQCGAAYTKKELYFPNVSKLPWAEIRITLTLSK